MSDDIIPRCILIIILVFAASLFAAAETAYSYCNRVRMRSLAENGDRRAVRVCAILDDFDGALVTLLIGINVLCVIISSVSTVLTIFLLRDIKIISGYASLISTILVTIVVFIFDETIPKNIAHSNADSLALLFSFPLHLLMIILRPLILFFRNISELICRILKSGHEEPSITSDEFSRAIDSAENTGGISGETAAMIRDASAFRTLKAENLMTGRDKIVYIDLRENNKDNLRDFILTHHYSRYPLCDGGISNIIGVVLENDITDALISDQDIDLRGISLPPLTASGNTGIGQLYDMMITSHCHMAIIKNKDKTAGLITLNDILSVLFAESRL